MTVITMSRKELARLQTLISLAERRTRIDDAAALLGMSRRQTYWLLSEFRDRGPEALASKRRGKPGNQAHGPILRRTVLENVRERYEDFGPTLAAEKTIYLVWQGEFNFEVGHLKLPAPALSQA